ncbi:WXG100 family type VII secretion target [Nocardia sp. alder85J]|uniref:WXG100 family type VII secretion target n=1 Tax=Nocardia sp. alder85J TaxID=2862949 RepID=UPI001CD61E10|nr:WXG100 family type VII secretion target [Nocardia sp. alder85J]MCX4096656.1 WXG100 family type VII secretion target [Nocardia sp. alder85J]
MTGDKFTVDLAHLDQIVARMNGLAGFLTDTFDEIDRRVKALHSGDWDSVAASAHADAHNKWIGEAREFAQGVADATGAAKRIHARYNTAVEVNTKMLKG